jgi:hypothetical protein
VVSCFISPTNIHFTVSVISRRCNRLLLLVLLGACGRSPAVLNPTPENTQPSIPATPVDRSGAHWRLSPRNQTERYRSTTTTVVDIAGTHDMVQTNTIFNLGIQDRNAGLTINTMFDSVSIQAPARIETTPVTPILQHQISAHLENSTLKFTDNSNADCVTQSVLIPLLSHAVSRLPLDLRTGMTWTDTLSLIGCTGGVPTTLTSVRSYQVMGEQNTGPIRGIEITRSDKTTSAGEGEQGQHRVGISSTSSGSAQLLIDSQTGSLLQSTGQYSGTVTVVTSGRQQVFNQTVRETIQRM